ncbi:MAG: pyruvate, phosphate dikinase, partial [Rhodovarius sp.]|nr:pyruvate, phosphate dikinase [Rhodovarius sp.]
MTQWVYSFGAGLNEGRADMRELLGGKGANLAEMASLGLPVPPGFTITTAVCTYYYAHGRTYPPDLPEQVEAALARIEKAVGLGFGSPDNPLLVSVRSGARVSMPGMMDTVLNLGLNDVTVQGLARASGDARFAWDSYRRFIQMFGSVVLGVDHHRFEEIIEAAKLSRGVAEDTELTAADWQEVVAEYKQMIEEVTGQPFPQDPKDQLWRAIGAVFGSWMNQRAITYRRLHDIPEGWGTAVNVQAMVFGNMGEDCATGVCFTRDPSTGENVFYGEYLVNAQGEDVVAGIRTPQPMSKARAKPGERPMEEVMPAAYAELLRVREVLERHYKDMQDIEFTVQKNKLYMLQTRTGKRTAAASLRIAVDMANEGLISREEAIMRVSPASLDQLLHPTLDPAAPRRLLAKGLPASPGAACGAVVFSADEAEARGSKGEAVILVRIETSPEDIHGMHAARGILTTRGGMTSHAAVVARGM